uniref:Aldedh domain-containing protein n=1 Tax=Ascaris lumbricoides TaxID=6252 RepID=A0A0M3IDW0_ASCLU
MLLENGTLYDEIVKGARMNAVNASLKIASTVDEMEPIGVVFAMYPNVVRGNSVPVCTSQVEYFNGLPAERQRRFLMTE